MKINAIAVSEARKNRCWSQEELAIAAGLNLRTVQRIEREANCSIQSKKALAAALEIDIIDLDYIEVQTMIPYEFKTIELTANDGFLSGLKKSELPDIEQWLAEYGEQGWQLVQILTPDAQQGTWSGKLGRMVAVLQRPKC